MSNSKMVVPGEFLSYEEEFMPGKNTFSLDGQVYSALVGYAEFDDNERIVGVKAIKSARAAGVGTHVLARVMLVKESAVLVQVMTAFKDTEKRVFSPTYASIYVAHVSSSYVKNLRDEFRKGDIVKAMVAEVTPYGIKLRTNEPSLGVIKGFCSHCRNELHLNGQNLRCLKCNAEETRKISTEYVL
ncbi:MAG: exosome complex RNA-binding protein Csl4 [Candidatus Diapherotrites archaeon]|nr:exosome complex RNA-binding protein Csl4 [Candidatus Diapherotrites archaeon]